MLNTHVTWECLKQGSDLLGNDLLVVNHSSLHIASLHIDCELLNGIVPTESRISAALHVAAVELCNDSVVPKPLNESVLCVLGIKCTVA